MLENIPPFLSDQYCTGMPKGHCGPKCMQLKAKTYTHKKTVSQSQEARLFVAENAQKSIWRQGTAEPAGELTALPRQLDLGERDRRGRGWKAEKEKRRERREKGREMPTSGPVCMCMNNKKICCQNSRRDMTPHSPAVLATILNQCDVRRCS